MEAMTPGATGKLATARFCRCRCLLVRVTAITAARAARTKEREGSISAVVARSIVDSRNLSQLHVFSFVSLSFSFSASGLGKQSKGLRLPSSLRRGYSSNDSRQPRASTAATAVSGSGGVGDGLLYGESPLLSLPATSSSDGCGKHGSHGLRLRLSPLVDGRRGGVPASELRLPLVSVLLGSSGFRLPLSVSGENATQQRHGEASSLLLRSPSGGATQRSEAADGTAAYPSP
nr:hypothetical protein Iba_chr02bCG8900 [Ipomoea batatas]